jgi:hypothetical protein
VALNTITPSPSIIINYVKRKISRKIFRRQNKIKYHGRFGYDRKHPLAIYNNAYNIIKRFVSTGM